MTISKQFIKRPQDLQIMVLAANVFLCCTILFFYSCTKIYSEQDLYGIWEGQTEDTEMIVTFNQDLTCKIVYGEIDSESLTITGEFEVDFTKKPVPLTIRNIPQLNHPLHTIIEFRKPDVIKIAGFSPRWRLRPVSFNRYTEITLKKAPNPPLN